MDLSNLPPAAAIIAETIGAKGFLALVEHYGGTPVKVHVRPKLDSELAKVLGDDAYRRLQTTFSGEEITVPLLHTARLAERNAEIVAAYAGGETAASIARRLGMHIASIRNVIAKAVREQMERRQGRLF